MASASVKETQEAIVPTTPWMVLDMSMAIFLLRVTTHKALFFITTMAIVNQVEYPTARDRVTILDLIPLWSTVNLYTNTSTCTIPEIPFLD